MIPINRIYVPIKNVYSVVTLPENVKKTKPNIAGSKAFINRVIENFEKQASKFEMDKTIPYPKTLYRNTGGISFRHIRNAIPESIYNIPVNASDPTPMYFLFNLVCFFSINNLTLIS